MTSWSQLPNQPDSGREQSKGFLLMVKMLYDPSLQKVCVGQAFVGLTTLSKSAKITDNVDRCDSPSVVRGSRGKEQ